MKKVVIVLMMALVLNISQVGNVYAAPNSGSSAIIKDGTSVSDGQVTVTQICNYIPEEITNIVGTIVTIIKIGVPIILIVMGMIDMGKAVASQKDDEIKKGQKTLISRVIAAGIVFFVVSIVQLLVNIVEGGQENTNSIWTCVSKLVGNK